MAANEYPVQMVAYCRKREWYRGRVEGTVRILIPESTEGQGMVDIEKVAMGKVGKRRRIRRNLTHMRHMAAKGCICSW